MDIAYYILRMDCLLIAVDAQMFSHYGYGPGTNAQGAADPPGPVRAAPGSWSLVSGPYPLWVNVLYPGRPIFFVRQHD